MLLYSCRDSILDDARKLRVLDEGDLVDVLGLVASHEQILVQIPEIWNQFVFHELSIQVRVVVLQVNEVIVAAVGQQRV